MNITATDNMTSRLSKSQHKSNVHPLIFTDKEQLHRAYMPFIRHGGLFVKTTQNYSLGDEVFLLIQLPDEAQKYSIAGKVVWCTPLCAQGGKASGIGVQLPENDSGMISKKITKLIADLLQTEQNSETL